MDYTNVLSLELLEQELTRYEQTVVVGSAHFNDYVHPADLIKNALIRIITSSKADTYSMMRRLAEHMNDKIDDEYSDFTIRMLAASTKDVRANQLIMSLLYITRDVLVGDTVDLHDQWLYLIDRNMEVYIFLRNYARSDQKHLEETYSGNIIGSAKTWEKMTIDDITVSLPIGYANYDVKLNGDVMQTVSFVASPTIHRESDALPTEDLTIVSDVILTPTIGVFALDKSILFYDDAKAQLDALGNRYIHGYDTQFTLPGLFYSVSLSIISNNHGNVWRVSEVNILPPSITRQLA